MIESRLPPGDAVAILLGPALLAAAVLFGPVPPGPGPLGLCTAAAVLHAAVLMPAFGRLGPAWGVLPLLLALPAVGATAFGHRAAQAWNCLLLIAAASAAGAAGRALRGRISGHAYLPCLLLLIAAPYALAHLAEEFGDVTAVAFWRTLSPVAAAFDVGAGGRLPPLTLLPLLAWPTWALVRLRGMR